MKKVLLKKINIDWKLSELIEHIKAEQEKEPEAFLDGSSMSIVVIK